MKGAGALPLQPPGGYEPPNPRTGSSQSAVARVRDDSSLRGVNEATADDNGGCADEIFFNFFFRIKRVLCEKKEIALTDRLPGAEIPDRPGTRPVRPVAHLCGGRAARITPIRTQLEEA